LKKHYTIPFIFALALHLVVVFFLFVEFSSKTPQSLAGQQQPVSFKSAVIKAVVVDAQQVKAEMMRIKKARTRKLEHARHVLRKMRQRARAARQKRRHEEARVVKMRAEQKRIAHRIVLARRKQKAAEEKAKSVRLKAIKAAQLERAAQEELKQAVPAPTSLEVPHFHSQVDATSGSTRRTLSEIERYKVMIVHHIGQKWIVPASFGEKVSCQLFIRVAKGGKVLSAQILKSSGYAVLDRSARTAVLEASPLPVPSEKELFNQFRELRLTVRPENVTSEEVL